MVQHCLKKKNLLEHLPSFTMGFISLELILLFFATELKLPGDRQGDRNHTGINRSCFRSEPLSTCGLNQINSNLAKPRKVGSEKWDAVG